MPESEAIVPVITNEDIDWVQGFLKLSPFDEQRRSFLSARKTIDVSACPGSGKTTLIVAKLAILARGWSHKSKGICVLSHTNVAHSEIQRRLGSSVYGQRLLKYPHFIGTLHSFFNSFLALPWLNSNGYPSPTIDDDIASGFRRQVVGNEFSIVRGFLDKKNLDFSQLRIVSRNLEFNIAGKAFPSSETSKSYLLAKK
ncbi:MAG: UvrD-helicase domain-containing protein, partial [Pirellula sp.]